MDLPTLEVDFLEEIIRRSDDELPDENKDLNGNLR